MIWISNTTHWYSIVFRHTTSVGAKSSKRNALVDKETDLVFLFQFYDFGQRTYIAHVHVNSFDDKEFPSHFSSFGILI